MLRWRNFFGSTWPRASLVVIWLFVIFWLSSSTDPVGQSTFPGYWSAIGHFMAYAILAGDLCFVAVAPDVDLAFPWV